jgi:hypothetical protein
MEEGVDGLLYDKTRPPGKAPLPLEVVQRVIKNDAQETAARCHPLEPPGHGQGGRYFLEQRAAHLAWTWLQAASDTDLQAVQRSPLRGEGRQGVETTFVKAPRAETPEEQLVVQFQGMIAEYERAQIAERSRRGKRHHPRAGSVNVLSSTPYGHRYVRKTEAAGAYYEIIEAEAGVVRLIYEAYPETAVGQVVLGLLLKD